MSDTTEQPALPEALDFAVSVDTRVAKDGKSLSLVFVNGRGETVTAHLEPEGAGRLGGILMANALEAQKRGG